LIDVVVGFEEDLKKFVDEKNNDCDFQGLGYEMLDRISIIFMNYIIREPDRFLTEKDHQGRSYIHRIMYLIERVMRINQRKKDELDNCQAVKILIAMLETCKGKINDLFEGFVKFVLEQLKISKTVYYKIILIQAICSLVVYDPYRAMQAFDSLDVTQHLFEVWISNISKMTFDIEFKRSLMGLASVLVIPPEKLNKVISINKFRISK
jgi:hypothetical protein